MPNLTDGVISPSNYAEFSIKKVKNKDEQFFIVVLGHASYIRSIKVYWLKDYHPDQYSIEIGKNLFNWDKKFNFRVGNEEESGLVVSKGDIENTAGFFVKVSIRDSKKDLLRISEIEIFKGHPEEKVDIQNFKVINIKEYSATFQFDTSLPTTAYVRIGESPHALKDSGFELDIYNDHKITIGNLLKGTRFYVQPVAVDVNGRIKMGQVYNFKTKGIPLPRFYNFEFYNITPFTLNIFWEANVPCRMELFISQKGTPLKSVFKSEKLSKKQRLIIEKIIPQTDFVSKIVLTDKNGNQTEEEKGFISSEHNIAFKQKVYGSFLFRENQLRTPDLANLGRITDGNLEVEGIALSGNVYSQEQGASIDLGDVYSLKTVRVIFRAVDFPSQFDLYLGNDLKKMKPFKKKISMKKFAKSTASQGMIGLLLKEVSIDMKNRKARYVLVKIPKGTKVDSGLPFTPSPFLQLAEIKVMKTPDYGEPQYIVKIIE
ncbi:MAG: hypothetical protein JW827_09315 [Spirochaetes bacterium]|nr:hypothetical protein [Spirochaetota bacterium]